MEKFDPQEYLLGILQKAVARKKDISVSHNDYGELVVFTENGEYHANISDLQSFCRVSSSELKVKELSPKESNAITQEKGIGRNIDELLWQAGCYASQGRLMNGLSLTDVVHMKHWPNLTRLPNNFNTFQITAMLTKHPTTIMFAHRVLKVPEREVCEFYSAAYCAGLAEMLNTPPVELSEVAESKEGTLLSRIIGRIANL
jgi:hypothetical protein